MDQDQQVIYTARARRLSRWSATLLVAAAGGLPSAVGVAAIRFWNLPVSIHVYVLVLVAAATVVTWGLALAVAPLLGSQRLRRRLAEKIAAQPGGREFIDGAFFVGFSPTEKLMQWDGDTDWDVGFLKVVGDTLAFWGDRCRWSLPRNAVARVEMVSKPDVPRVVLRWSEADLSGVAALTSREGWTVDRARQGAAMIQAAMHVWLAQTNGGEGVRWGWPPTEVDAPGGHPVADIGLVGCLGLMAAFAIAATTCLLVALPQYTAGLKALGIMQAVAVGWPLLVVVSELAVAGR